MSRLDGAALDESAFLFDPEGAVADEVLQVCRDRALRDRFGVENGEVVVDVVAGLGADVDR